MLWGRAAGLCSMPSSRIRLFIDPTETDDEALIGEHCHIVGESKDGPRGNHPMPMEQRDKYDNLILLCRNHHKEIDSQTETFTIEVLHNVKNQHETWVRGNLPGFDAKKQEDDEYYAGVADEWTRKAHLDEWLAWSSHILSHGQPRMLIELSQDLAGLRRWLLTRIWPGRYPDLEKAFATFRVVLEDFHETFLEHAEEPHPSARELRTREFYKIDEWNPELYHELLKQYEYHVDLVDDLMLELTRAANFICDEVRASILRSFRLDDGRSWSNRAYMRILLSGSMWFSTVSPRGRLT